MEPTRLLLVRHGHTAANTPSGGSALSGWTDLPLSVEGRNQASRLAARLADGFEAICSSPLARARETAERIRAERADPPGVTLCPALREIGCGLVDGWPLDDVRDRYPDLWARNERQDDGEFRWPGGESYRELRARTLRAVRLIAQAHRGRRVVVVSHAGPISQVVGRIHGLPPARWGRFRPENATVTEIECDGPALRLVRFSDPAG